MGTNDFSVTVEKLDGLGDQLNGLAGWFAALGSLTDTSRAQRAADSVISSGALATFSETMFDALNATAKALENDAVKLAKVARRYRDNDACVARAADALSKGDIAEIPDLSVRQSQVTRGILDGLSGLDDLVVPATRALTNTSDRVQQVVGPGIISDVLESGEDVARGAAQWARDVSGRADRVLVLPRNRANQ